jgi:uncharacterized membrane protein YfhO
MEANEKANLLKEWLDAKKAKDIATQKESDLRVAVVKEFFQKEYDDNDARGTFTVKLPDNAQIKLMLGTNVKLDAELFTACRKAIEEKDGLVIENIFDFKPQLKESLFNKLPKEDKLKLLKYGFLEFSRSSPQVKFIPSGE